MDTTALAIAACLLGACAADAGPPIGGDDISDPAVPAPLSSSCATDPDEPHADCCAACDLVYQCTHSHQDLTTCYDRCVASDWVEGHEIECLALRIFWIDEEGCGTIVPTYQSYDPADDCTD
jgi:hypothetical protein